MHCTYFVLFKRLIQERKTGWQPQENTGSEKVLFMKKDENLVDTHLLENSKQGGDETGGGRGRWGRMRGGQGAGRGEGAHTRDASHGAGGPGGTKSSQPACRPRRQSPGLPLSGTGHWDRGREAQAQEGQGPPPPPPPPAQVS